MALSEWKLIYRKKLDRLIVNDLGINQKQFSLDCYVNIAHTALQCQLHNAHHNSAIHRMHLSKDSCFFLKYQDKDKACLCPDSWGPHRKALRAICGHQAAGCAPLPQGLFIFVLFSFHQGSGYFLQQELRSLQCSSCREKYLNPNGNLTDPILSQ